MPRISQQRSIARKFLADHATARLADLRAASVRAWRPSVSAYAQRFVLKGAALPMSWLPAPHRGRRDLDLLGFGDPDSDAMLDATHAVMAAESDGIVFDAAALRVERMRLATTGDIGGARGKMTINIAIGDAPARRLVLRKLGRY